MEMLEILTQEQIDMLVDLFGLEWVDYIEYVNLKNWRKSLCCKDLRRWGPARRVPIGTKIIIIFPKVSLAISRYI